MSFSVCASCPTTIHETCVRTSPDTCLKSCPDTYVRTSSDTSLKTCSITCPKPRSTTSKSIIIPRHCGTKATCAPKAHSVYGCGSLGSTRISTCTYLASIRSPCMPHKIGGCRGGFGARIMAGGCHEKDYDYLKISEKFTMQNLNDRLACYLEKVRSLEASNANLEKLIWEYYEKKRPICQEDYSCYLNTTSCLQDKIKEATIKNADILLQIDNAKLAAEDFRIKYEHESAMGHCVEADITNLRRILDKTYLSKADLEAQICILQEELAFMRKNHHEEVALLMCQLTPNICVEVDAAPQQDLNKVLDEIRCHYDTIIDKHRKKQECWFKEKTEELGKDVASNTGCMKTWRLQVADLCRNLQCLEIELQSQINLKGALQCSLADTEARYSAILAGFQKQINVLEAELCQMRTGIEQQGKDYAALLDIKSHLEKEIATYRCLLENQDIQ
nr:keratin, type I cytoskeletal 19-like [Misgurnus anguillicaudatus]